MAGGKAGKPAWEKAFLAAMRRGVPVAAAAAAGGISPSTAYGLKRKNARFHDAWTKAWQTGGRASRQLGHTRTTHWKRPFLQALAETSNVTASATLVNIPKSQVYQTRRDEPAFAARWRAALAEGYEHLEMELLGYLRNPDPERKLDIANALRLLAAHRQTVAKVRADEGNESEQEVLDSIDKFIDEMRERAIANNAVIAENVGLRGGNGD